MDIMKAFETVTSAIKSWANENKVAKIDGKGLSTNDYTDSDKNKLDSIDNIPNDLVVLDGKLYLAQDGVIIDDSAVTLPSGGGGGSSSGSITLTNNLTSNTITGVVGGDVLLKFKYKSNEDETGDGTAYIYVNDVLKMTTKISSGDNTINIGSCVGEGANIVKLTCMDQYSNHRNLSYTVEILVLSLSSTFDATVPYSSDIDFTYIPTVNASKIVHFVLDGKEIGTQEVTTSGRQEMYTIPKQPHGSHTLEVYFTVNVNEIDVESNRLYYDLICVVDGATTPIIACAYNNTTIEQFETINIPYIVYSPTSLTSAITLSENENVVSELNVDRTKQNWSFRADEYGKLVLTITCGTVVKTLGFDVTKSNINVEATTNNLELHLSSYGRSNNESNPAHWKYKDINCIFKNYNWASDGWLTDEEGISVHRVAGDARLTIPLKIFASDFRSTGKTLEFEFRTKDVRDYDAEIINCYSGGIGFKMTAQMAMLKSEQSEISTQYKEDEHIRVAFVVEKRATNRLLLIYLNGIMCGAAQYPDDDDFSQASPVDINIGSNDCIIDIYNIRVYNNDLTRYQIVDNWIADTQNVILRAERYSRNNVFDAYGNIVIENLPNNLPYMILKCGTLPQSKNDKLNVSGKFVDPTNNDKSFEFTDAQISIQGTSSAGYARKNYKLKLKNGLVQNGVVKNSYQMRDDSIAASIFCFKADVASSEGCNNVELVKQYNDVCPYKTPAQQENPAYRQAIDGFPMVIFHDDGKNITFIGKYNFNFDKSSGHWGLGDGDESWEVKNNTSDRVIWKSADFDGDDWKNDFEAMHPENNEDTSRLKAFAEWVVSTDRKSATNLAFDTSIDVDGVTYESDTAGYRLAKFRHELANYCEVDSAVFFYLFSLLYLSIDTRAKNTFPSWQGDSKLYWIAYDWDSTVGCDNVGTLKFGYEIEDTDILPSGAQPFNGQDSVFWCNIRDAFGEEIKELYQELRSTNKLSYEITEKAYADHQAVWPEAIWNQDAYYKYLEPLIEDGASIYLPMLQGSKSEQRKWWLYNRYRYIDSKYNAGDALKDFITLRGYAKSDISVEPYADIYASIKYGSYLEQVRALRGSSYTLECPLDNVNDTEIYIYSASQLKSVGDLSGLKVGLADFSMATKLQSLKVGDANPDYSNGNLNSLTLGNNVLLKTIDVRNCNVFGTGEQQSLDIGGCTNVEEVYLTGTALKGINLPVGGVLKTLHLPDTITNLTIRNQPSLTDFVLNDSSSLTTLRLENVGSLIDAPSVINNMADGSRIRALDIDWEIDTESDLVALLNKLIKMRGLDENGNNTSLAVLTGRIRVSEKVSDEVVGNFYNYFNDVVIDDGSSNIYILNYKDRDGKILYSVRVAKEASAVDPIEKGYIERPEPIITDTYRYEFAGWSALPTSIDKHYVIIATYHTKFAIHFYSDDELVYTQWSIQGDPAVDPVATGVISAPIKTGTADISYKFSGWDNLPINVQSSTSVYALFDTYWAVRFWNDSSLYLTEWVVDGGTVIEPEDYFEDYTDPTRESTAQYDYHFSKWDGDFDAVMISARDFYAVYTSTIRRYNVYFYNEDTLLQTKEDIQYGSSTSYSGSIPVKTGVENPEEYVFKGWMPAPENITGETYCYPLFKFTGYLFGKLSDDSEYGTVDAPNWDKINAYWDTINSDVESMNADELFAKYPIGGRMIIPVNLSDGMVVADVEIIGHNHDNLADDSGKASLTFFCVDLPQILHRMNEDSTNIGGYKTSEMRQFVNEELVATFPSELKTIIKPVYKISDSGARVKSLVTTIDSCWLASYDEVGLTSGSSNLPGQGELYASIFSNNKDTRKKYITDETTTGGWWLRSSYYSNNSDSMFWRVTNSGGSYSDIAFNSFYVAFGFCI